MVLVVGAQHRFASRTHIDKDELLGLSFVSLHRSSTVQGIKNTLVGQGVDWRALKVVMVSHFTSAAPLCLIARASASLSSEVCKQYHHLPGGSEQLFSILHGSLTTAAQCACREYDCDICCPAAMCCSRSAFTPPDLALAPKEGQRYRVSLHSRYRPPACRRLIPWRP